MRTLRIGSGAGYGGDRLEPAIDLIRRGNLDYIIFECLAERTIALAQLEKQADPQKGYNSLLEYRMRAILAALKDHPTRVITNMGAANPRAAAQKTRELAREAGLFGLKVACVTGDNVLATLSPDLPILETGAPLSSLGDSVISANAYLGCEGICKALEAGADIVITGRVADPALVLGPLRHEFGWAADDFDKLGKGILAGHLLECAGQVTGGYFADPGMKDVPELWNLGFPLAEITEAGDITITKLPDTGGLVSEATCQEQLLYEIQDPTRYFTPDCTADFSGVTTRQIGPDRVQLRGATGRAHNGQYKVSVGYQDCWIGEGQISYYGATARERAALAGEIVRRRLEVRGCAHSELRIDLLGVNSLFPAAGPVPPEVRLRVAARTADRANAALVGDEVEALYTNGPGGGGGAAKQVRKIVSVASVFLPQSAAKAQVEVREVKA